ncbi:cytochrome P450 6A1-like [Ceratina calcarata]|uniref:Cytochrome P450 6A1-like n=1 Tax=Ceratina calcarata TaxID=156304 RepID=A0AAJ7WGA6_9HYME|nr:cytochrome P450 6A1-like [Ceratina calcarata]
MGWLEIVCGLILLLLFFYYRAVKSFQFWKERGIPGPEPMFLFGNVLPVFMGLISLGDHVTKYYEQYKHLPVFGMFIRSNRVLVVNDPDIIQTILVKDFSKFANRGIALNESMEPLSQHLFLLEPKRWRPLRTRLSPTFTSGKLKEMFSMIIECSNTFEKYVDSLIANGNNIDVREVCARFTTDVISSCAFGLDTNAMSGENNKFREIGKTFFNMSLVQRIKIQLREGLPTLYTLLGYILPRDDMTQFFTKVVNDVIDYRRKNNVVRQDFIHTLMDLQDHPEKLSISMTLKNLFKQTLRKLPPITVIMRKSCEDYYFESLKLSIPKGTRIFIPTYAIHRDPEVYPNPEVYDISRFTEEAVKARHPMHYLPFGDGPRNCIGARFAIFQTKIGLIKVIKNFKVDVCEQTQIPFINDPRMLFLSPKDGKLILKLTKLEK